MPRLKKKIISVSVIVLIICASIGIYGGRALYIPPILMYHSLVETDNPPDSLSVSVKSFERQMSFLTRNHYNVITLESLAAMLKARKKIPPKTVVLTFDDGRKDNYLYAFPILKKYNLPITLFIIVDEVGRFDRVTWEEIQQMRDSGLVTIGSHSLSHPYMIDIKDEKELRRQIFDSKKILEQRLGKDILTFCYPIGAFNAKVQAMVRDAGYLCAVAILPGKHIPNDDLFALKRAKVTEKAGNMFIFWALNSGYYSSMKELLSSKKKGYGY
jgi:peptidoglycan/xylan/chitin deacetylase (PgdA/CDA1 family)